VTKSMLMLSEDHYVERACADLGVELTVVYGASRRDWGSMVELPGQRHVFVNDATSVESVLLGLYRAGLDPAAFDAIYSTDEGGVVTAAALGRAFGLRSMSPEVMARFRDKSLAKAALAREGVDVARFEVIEDLHENPDDHTLPFEPAVLKPVAGGGTQHTTLIRSAADLRAAAHRAREDRGLRAFILEEFVPGQERHVDGVMFGGQLLFMSIGGYRKTCLTTISDGDCLTVFTFDPVADADVYARVTPLAERALGILGLQDGVFHMEVFDDEESGRLVFGECAARRGGALIEEQNIAKFGVSLAAAAVQCALGIRPEIKPVLQPGVFGGVFLPYTPGVLFSTPSAEELIGRPGVEYALVEFPVGAAYLPVGNTTDSAGRVFLVAESREELFQRADEVVTWFGERTVIVPPKASARELRQWYARHVPDGKRATSAWRREPTRPASPVGTD
jgi:biotin carboxylase